MPELAIQFSTSPAFASGIIRRLCHSAFSHVDIVVNDAKESGLLGVSGPDHKTGDPGGVRLRVNPPWQYKGKPKIAKLKTTEKVRSAVIKIGYAQIGKPFDDGALWSFLGDSPFGDRDWRSVNSWFCSEFVIYCLEQAKFFPYPLVAVKDRVTPADCLLLLNPFMTPANILEFLE